MDDELCYEGDIHLLKLFMGHNRYGHGHKLDFMSEMFSTWIEKHIVIDENALHLNEHLVIKCVTITYICKIRHPRYDEANKLPKRGA